MNEAPNPFADRLGEIEGDAAEPKVEAAGFRGEEFLAGPRFVCETCGKEIFAPAGTLRRWCSPACRARKNDRYRLIKKLRKVHAAKRVLLEGKP
jgi:hypothetical protein